jgi:hypothetical protein
MDFLGSLAYLFPGNQPHAKGRAAKLKHHPSQFSKSELGVSAPLQHQVKKTLPRSIGQLYQISGRKNAGFSQSRIAAEFRPHALPVLRKPESVTA